MKHAGGERKTIMFAEDDPAMRLLGTSLLIRDYEVIGVGDGEEALAVLKTSTPVDLLVTDIAMPRLDGLQLLAWVRANRPDLPCLIVSGSLDRCERHLRLGGCAFLAKPYRNIQLVDAVRRMMATAAGAERRVVAAGRARSY